MLSEYGDDSQWAIKTTGWCDNVSIVTDWWKNRRKFQARFAMARKTRFLYHVFNSIKNSHFPRLKISFYATCAKRHCAQPRVKNSYAIHRLVEQTFLYNMALKTLRNCVRKVEKLTAIWSQWFIHFMEVLAHKRRHIQCLERWFFRMHKCIAVRGQYFEKVKAVLPARRAWLK